MTRPVSIFLFILGMIPLGSHANAQSPKEITNSIGMKLVLIPKGTFMMGSPESEKGRDKDDETQHEVTISKDYYLGVIEVTQGQYEKVMGTNPSHFQKQFIRKSDSSMYPVEQVSWEDAVDFCKKLSEGSKSAYSFGETSKSLGDYAWFDRNSKGQTHPVGERKPNAWGLYDMHGNVWEWCSDRYGEYPKVAVSDPVGPREGSLRVLRGGSWCDVAASCRSAIRRRYVPSIRGNDLGFRLALSSSGIPK
jgi:formylglycine-generating enzyme required for sulfatase activity